MKVFEYKEGKDARLILTGMIVSNQVLAAIASKWKDGGLFGIRFMDTIGGWCVRHYNKYHKSPGENILSHYDRWSRSGDKPGAREVEQFLGGLNAEYVRRKRKTIQADYILTVAEEYFTKVRVESLTKEANALIAAGKYDKADAVLRDGAKVELTDSEMVPLFKCKEVMRSAWETKDEVLIEYEGAAKEIFQGRMKRKGFVAFQGGEKSTKSFWLLDTVWRALEQGRKVAHFECGDLPREEVIERMVARASGKSIDTEPYDVPVSIVRSEHSCDTVLERRQEKTPMSVEEMDKWRRRCERKWGDNYMLCCVPPRSISVNGIANKLRQLRSRSQWVPDVVVVDYADILAPVNGTAETRDQINTTWIMLRAIAMSMSCLVVTASQATRTSYNAEMMDMEHTSEDKRKLGHVTAMFGIMRPDDEVDKGLTRINVVVGRKGKFVRKNCLYAAGSLAIANPMMYSTL